MKRLLVTGSLGLVGSSCTRIFEGLGWEVIGLDANLRSQFFGTKPQKSKHGYTYNIDIRDEREVEDLFKLYRFDAIIHAAAQPSHDWASTNILTDFDINARGTVILLEMAHKYCPQAVFVYVSTDKIYGENMVSPEHIPFNETLGLDTAGHRSFFGCSKTAADIYVQEYAAEFGMKTACFRPGCITGKAHQGAEQHGFLAYLTKCVKEGRTYRIFGFEGRQVRDQIHADDLAMAFYHFIKDPKSGAVYNIGGGPSRSISVLEALEKIGKLLKKPATYELHAKRPGDREWDVHDVSKFKKDYPAWKYRYSLSAILRNLL